MRIGQVGAELSLQWYRTAVQTAARAVTALASGQAVRTAADGAAQLAIAQRLEALQRGAKEAGRHSGQGWQLLQTAEGGLASLSAALQRLRELAVRAGNPSLSDADRAALQAEADALLGEMAQTVASTRYNGLSLLDGSLTQRTETVTRTEQVLVDPGQPASVEVQPAAEDAGEVSLSGTPQVDEVYQVEITSSAVVVPANTTILPDPKNKGSGRLVVGSGSSPTTNTSYEIKIKDNRKFDYEVREARRGGVLLRGEVQTGGEVTLPNGAVVRFADPVSSYHNGDIFVVETAAAVQNPAMYRIAWSSGSVTGAVTDQPVDLGNGLTLRFDLGPYSSRYEAGDVYTVVARAERPPRREERTVTETRTVSQPLAIQVGPSAGQFIQLVLPNVHPSALGLGEVALGTPEQATASLSRIDAALATVSGRRAAVGALMAALERNQRYLDVYSTNLLDSRSRLVEADLAQAATEYGEAQVRLRTGTAVTRAYWRFYRDEIVKGLLVSAYDTQALTRLATAGGAALAGVPPAPAHLGRLLDRVG